MNKIILVILLMLFLLPISVLSHEPSPPLTQGQPGKMISESSTTGKIETQNGNTQSDNPMLAQSKNKETNKTDATAEKSYAEKSGKDSSITTMWDYNFWLILFTGVLAICNVVLCFFNIMLWLSTKKSANAAKESTELVKQGFIATHRPKLRVHSIYLQKLDSIPSFTNSSTPITHQINYSIGNVGGSTATITGVNITFKRLNKPLPVPSYSDPNLSKKSIACGESVTESCDVEAFVIDCNIERGLNDLYFFGYIDYRDDIGTTRRTAFCRRYSHDTKRFTKVEDEDYEYSY